MDCSVVNVKSNFKSFIKGEGILRNTSNEIEFHKRIKLFTEKLKVREYKIQMIENIFSEINFKDRQNKLKKKTKCENRYNITFITHYYPKAEILQRIIRKYWHIIKNDPTIGTIALIEPKLCINHWKVLYKLCVFYVDRYSKMTTTAGHSFYIGPIGFLYYQVNDTGS